MIVQQKMRNGRDRTCNLILRIYSLSQLSYALLLESELQLRMYKNLL